MQIALYRKYRPQRFCDVVGQEHVTRTLLSELGSNTVAHAYLFTGTRGCGKTSCSKILAKAVNCESPKDGEPCLECSSCVGIENGSILDVVEIDAASNSGVDNIRELKEEAVFTPVYCKYRVYIIDETHMLSSGAFNALLKIMEEPPEHVIFILATTEVHKVPATILSRAQRFDFRRINRSDIADRLCYVAESEGFSLSSAAAEIIGQVGDGSMRDSLSILDKCRSASDDISEDVVRNTIGIVDKSYIFSVVKSIIDKDIADVMEKIDKLYFQSKDMQILCAELCSIYRDIMVIKLAGDSEKLTNLSKDDYKKLCDISQSLSARDAIYAVEVLADTHNLMSRSKNRKMNLDLAVVKLCDKSEGSSLKSAMDRIEKLEQIIASGGIGTALPTRTKPVADSPKKQPEVIVKNTETQQNKIVVEPQSTEEQPFTQWPDVIEMLRTTNGALFGALVNSLAYIKGDIVLIDSEDELFLRLVRESDVAKDSIRKAIEEQTGKVYRLGPYKKQKKTDSASEDTISKLAKDLEDSGIPVSYK